MKENFGMQGVPRTITGIFVALVSAGVIFLGGCGHNDAAQEAFQRCGQASILMNDGDYVTALPLINAAIQQFVDAKNDSASGESYLLAASCYQNLGKYDSALTDYQNAMQSFQSYGDQNLERKGRILLSEFYYDVHDDDAALTLASDAAGSAKVLNDLDDMTHSLTIAANASHRLGNYDQEISLLSELSQTDSMMNHRDNSATYIPKQMFAYQAAGQYDKARSVWNAWYRRVASSNDNAVFVPLYTALGDVQYAFNFPDSALRSYSQALGHIAPETDPIVRGHLLSALGNLAYRARHVDNARMYYADAELQTGKGNDVADQQMLKAMLVACDWKLSGTKSGVATSELLKRCRDIVTVTQQTGFHFGSAFAFFVQGRIMELKYGPDSAAAVYREAIHEYEYPSTVSNRFSDYVRTFMTVDETEWYDPLLQASCANNITAETFQLAERKNLHDIDRFFSDLTITTFSPKLNHAISQFQRTYHFLESTQDGLTSELASEKKKNTSLIQALNEMSGQYAGQIHVEANDVGKYNPNFTWLLSPGQLTLKQVQDSLPRNSAVIEYIPLPTAVYILLVTHDSAYIRKSQVAGSRVQELVQEYRSLIGDPRLNDGSLRFGQAGIVSRIDQLSTVLAGALIDPIRNKLDSSTILYIVSSKEFGWLPFHTLRENSSPLIDRFDVRYLPTAAVLFFTMPQEKYIADIIGIGHPGKTSWDVEYELKDIRGFYDKARMLFNSTATLTTLDTAAYQLLHFAAEFHGYPDVPNKSAAILSDGKTPFGLHNVRLGEMLAFPPPQVLIFSNITPNPGELSRYAPLAFLANGTPTVITTMWQGERKGKKYFGEIFYTGIHIGTPSSQAYHEAMVALTKKAEFEEPDKWGLFYRFGK